MKNNQDMGVLSENERQLNFYYYPGHKISKEALAYAESSDAKLNAVNIEKTKVTGTQWVELAEMLGVKVTDFLEKDHPAFKEKFDKDAEIGTEDAVKILQNNPELLVFPIATRGKKAIHVKMMTDILKLTKPDTLYNKNE
jgi:arsenate reductase-like glutaredoxin family protein